MRKRSNRLTIDNGLFVDCTDKKTFDSAIEMYQVKDILIKDEVIIGVKEKTVFRYKPGLKT
ncbi:hypothetical protein DRO31_08230 [Candidatus Bathyarchaeota archaeon]|nr:MAG: hypothetical protein DRO31_08230 [Candidatus Bathyarchaeota archaeon]